MRSEQCPSLYQAADSASLTAQHTYILLQRMYLGSLILGSVVGAFTPVVTGSVSKYLHTAIAILLGLGLLVLWITRARRDDKVWFDCRAIAESVKTATWRYMMNLSKGQDGVSVDKAFVDELREIREARSGCERTIAGHLGENVATISEVMKKVRSGSFEERKQLYITDRLTDQRLWYSTKACLSARHGSLWFWVTAALQALAIALAVVQASFGPLQISLVPVITTIAATIAAWVQTKRYDELSKTYSLAAQELAELETIAVAMTSEGDFPQLVEQVEEAISREHTMWCARRDVRLNRR